MEVLERWCAIKREFITDHSEGNLSWHSLLGHLELGKVLASIVRAVNGLEQ